MGNSVVALKYESFLSPFHTMANKPKTPYGKRKSDFALKPVQVESKHESGEECTNNAPITFLPLPSPHLGNNLLKFPKYFKRIKEEEEEGELANSQRNQELLKNQERLKSQEKVKSHENIEEEPACKKKIFEEFFVFGMEKNDLNYEDFEKEKINDGFAQAKILYYFDGVTNTPSDWYFNMTN